MTHLGAVHDSALVGLAQHLYGVERTVWLVTLTLVVLGMIVVVRLLSMGAAPVVVSGALATTVGAFSVGMWAHGSVHRRLLQTLDRMSDEAAVRLAAVTAADPAEPTPGFRLPL